MTILHHYIENLKEQLDALPLDEVENGHKILSLAGRMKAIIHLRNGGSAGNAIQRPNIDFRHGISPNNPPAMRVTALTANDIHTTVWAMMLVIMPSSLGTTHNFGSS